MTDAFCLYAAVFGAYTERVSERVFGERSENCPVDRPLSYIFNYVGQYGANSSPGFSFFFVFPIRFLSVAVATPVGSHSGDRIS